MTKNNRHLGHGELVMYTTFGIVFENGLFSLSNTSLS